MKGGAYGCMSGIGRSGEGYFVSYRDPEVKKSDDIYLGIPAYLENFEADERTMTKYVIGTISDIDTPLTPSLQGSRGLSRMVFRSDGRDAEEGARGDLKRDCGRHPRPCTDHEGGP